jgi:leader peptidase (prepilin peptidase) / N-methyltransferase
MFLQSEYGLFVPVAAGIAGLMIGSFLNVLAHRLPRGESTVFPSSHCTFCGAPIAPRDNIPLISWILLGGRCRACRAPISIRYPMIELANGALWFFQAGRARSWLELISGVFLCSACLVLLVIDAEFQLLPDKITLTGIAAGVLLSVPSRRIGWSLAGAAIGAGGLFLLAFLYERISGREGMGLGDVKMLGMIGAFLGPVGVFVTVLLASFAGALVGIVLIATRIGGRQTRLPFGVFLSIGAVVTLFWGDRFVGAYRSLLP